MNTNIIQKNKLTTETEIIFDFQEYSGRENEIVELTIEGNGIDEIKGEALKKFTNLEILTITNTSIKQLPEEIGKLKNLEKLYLSNNCLECLPSSIENLTRLKILHLSRNKLKSLTEKIGKLISLTDLNVCFNELEELPKSLEKLTKLLWLAVSGNKLKSISSEIGKLINLQLFHLSNNQLTELPLEIGQLVNLQCLYCSKNQLRYLPRSIGNLLNLRFLYLFENELETLPSEIENLKLLKRIDLKNNRLVDLPRNFGNLVNLQQLYLNSNFLTFVPREFLKLKNSLNLLNLNDNPIQESGNKRKIGRLELAHNFQNKVVFDSIVKITEIPQITKEFVLLKIKSQKLHWNISKLKNLTYNAIPLGTLTEKEVLEKWNENIKPLISIEKNIIFVEYLKKLYNPSLPYKRWAMKDEFISLAINLIQAILMEFCNLLKFQNKKDTHDIIITNVSGICEGIKHCPDRQLSELRFTFNILRGNLISEDVSLEEFVKNFIVIKKEEIFDFVFTPGKSKQNVHVLNFWKKTLKDDLGFDFEFETNIGTMNQDPFDADPGIALDAFFKKFTPENIILLLTEEINNNKSLMCKAVQFIYETDLEIFKKKKMLKTHDFKNLMVTRITKNFVNFFLIKIGILEEL